MKKCRNPIAASLRSPHLRKQVVANKRKKSDRRRMRAQLKQGKFDYRLAPSIELLNSFESSSRSFQVTSSNEGMS